MLKFYSILFLFILVLFIVKGTMKIKMEGFEGTTATATGTKHQANTASFAS
jgi:uncharacterized membrane protein YphA (DoxX/SURF4 family)